MKPNVAFLFSLGSFLVCSGLSAAPANDAFASSTKLYGTNVSYVGASITTATFEADEPNPGYTNTIWASWAAPFTGRAQFSSTIVDWAEPVVIYTGPTLKLLQPVRIVGMGNGQGDFLAVEGTVYHFQISGAADECTLSLQLLPWQSATNDSFGAAERLSGEFVSGSICPIDGARRNSVNRSTSVAACSKVSGGNGSPLFMGVRVFRRCPAWQPMWCWVSTGGTRSSP